MENRFGLKDLVLMVLLVAVIVVILLGMKQYDRQWDVLQAIQQQQGEQSTQMQAMTRVLNRLAAAGPRNFGGEPQTAPATQPTVASGDDPFDRIEAAQKLPGYSEGDTLIEGITRIEKITPLCTQDAYGNAVIGRVLESLLTRDPVTLAWQPLVARSLPQISKDGLTFTFELRDDVTYSDGQPLTPDDVVYTYNWIMNPQVECPQVRAYYKTLKSVVKHGDNGVVFTFKEPYFKSEELAGGMSILPKHFYGKYTADEYDKSPGLLLGSGPYRMEDPTAWTPGKPMELVRNERYWGPAAPFNKVVYRTFGEDTAKLQAFRNGEIDLPDNLFPEQYREMLKDTDLLAHTQHFEFSSATAGYRYIAWNERRDGKPTRFADPRVRLAMTLLTDRQRMCDELNDKLATVIHGPFLGKNPQADPNLQPWPYDPKQAADLLKQAGYEDRDGSGTLRDSAGQAFSFQLIYPAGVPAYQQMVLFLKDSYAQAGIQLELNPLEWPVMTQKLKNRDFDAITLGWATGLETDLYQMFSTDQMKDGGNNAMSYSDPKLDALITEARRTMDVDRRMKLWQQCDDLLHKDQPYTFLLTRKELVFLAGRFQNVQLLPLGINSDLEWFVPAAQQKW
jgi:peptide/nickel transport system substrate-binding protein